MSDEQAYNNDLNFSANPGEPHPEAGSDYKETPVLESEHKADQVQPSPDAAAPVSMNEVFGPVEKIDKNTETRPLKGAAPDPWEVKPGPGNKMPDAKGDKVGDKPVVFPGVVGAEGRSHKTVLGNSQPFDGHEVAGANTLGSDEEGAQKLIEATIAGAEGDHSVVSPAVTPGALSIAIRKVGPKAVGMLQAVYANAGRRAVAAFNTEVREDALADLKK